MLEQRRQPSPQVALVVQQRLLPAAQLLLPAAQLVQQRLLSCCRQLVPSEGLSQISAQVCPVPAADLMEDDLWSTCPNVKSRLAKAVPLSFPLLPSRAHSPDDGQHAGTPVGEL